MSTDPEMPELVVSRTTTPQMHPWLLEALLAKELQEAQAERQRVAERVAERAGQGR